MRPSPITLDLPVRAGLWLGPRVILRRSGDPNLEETQDALLEGDRPYAPGSARAAFSHPTFRLVWSGSLASNIGTWMQNIALGVFGYQLTHSASFVALLGFAEIIFVPLALPGERLRFGSVEGRVIKEG